MNPRTLEADHRPLGTDSVFLCRSCEWLVLRARLRELAREHPFQVLGAVTALTGLLSGAGLAERGAEALLLLLLAGWVWLTWALRRRGPMCRAIFLHLRRAKLAAAHGLKPPELEAYVELP